MGRMDESSVTDGFIGRDFPDNLSRLNSHSFLSMYADWSSFSMSDDLLRKMRRLSTHFVGPLSVIVHAVRNMSLILCMVARVHDAMTKSSTIEEQEEKP